MGQGPGEDTAASLPKQAYGGASQTGCGVGTGFKDDWGGPCPGPQGLKDPLCVLPLGLLGWRVARGGMGSGPSPLILGRAETRGLGH